jgi:hypothetical protein
MERAPHRDVHQARRGSLDRVEAPAFLGDPRDRGHQTLGVRVRRALVDRSGRRLLDELARVHHAHVVRDLGDHPEVVRDQDHPHLGLPLDVGEELHDLRLDRHVERRRGLVGDEDGRIQGDADRDHHALAHPARELVRVVAQTLLRRGDPDPIHELQGLAHRVLLPHPAMHLEHLRDLIADGEHGIQCRQRVLEDHRDLGAAHRSALRVRERQEIDALVEELPTRDPARLLDQAHDGQRAHRLARARLAEDREALAGIDRVVDPVHGVDGAVVGVELDGEVLHLEQVVERGRLEDGEPALSVP